MRQAVQEKDVYKRQKTDRGENLSAMRTCLKKEKRKIWRVLGMHRFPGLQIYGKCIKKTELCSVKNKIITRRHGDEMEDYSIANTTKEHVLSPKTVKEYLEIPSRLTDDLDVYKRQTLLHTYLP